MKKAYLSIFLLSCFLALPFAGNALDEAGDELRLYLGEPKMISVNKPTRIVIGNPNIADVANVSETDMTINPKAPGTTTLVFWDNFGEQSYKIRVFTEDTNEVKRRIDNLLEKLGLSQVYTKAVDEEGKVMLLGSVKSPLDRERITIALGAFKDKTLDLIELKEEETAVEIDVQILELDKDATKTLGFTSPGSINLLETGSPGISDAGTKFSTLFKILNLQRGTSAGVNPFAFTLDALVQEGKARVLSRPRLSCQSGKEAELLVGGEKPILTTNVVSSVSGGSTNVDYKEFGIKLKIKPTVTPDRRIKLALNVEISEVGDAEILGRADEPTAKAFPLSKRNASTELFLNDGQTMAIGGLMKQKREEDVRKTAFLGDIPILGALFRKTTTKIGDGSGGRGDVELFITLTPQIIQDMKKSSEEKTVALVSPPAPPEFPSDPLTSYANIVQRRILEHLAYPSSAKEAGFQGTVKLSLHLSYKGELLETILKESSGYKILDDQAISVAKGVGSYPPFPASIEQKEVWIDIPIAYQLN